MVRLIEAEQFTYRGITANRSPHGSKLARWTAEIRRDRTFEFLRADSAAEMRNRMDAALDWACE